MADSNSNRDSNSNSNSNNPNHNIENRSTPIYNYNNDPNPSWAFMHPPYAMNGTPRCWAGPGHANSGSQPPSEFPFDVSQFHPMMANEWTRPAATPRGVRGGLFTSGHQQHRDTPKTGREADHGETETESSPESPRHTPNESVAGDAPRSPPPGAFFSYPPPPPQAFPYARAPVPPRAPNHPPHGPFHHGHSHPFGPSRGRGGRCERGGRRGPHTPPACGGPWDFRPLMRAISGNSIAEAFRDYMDLVRSGPSDDGLNEHQNDAFVPPVDVFNTEKAYVLHVSLPGALKEDIGVNWDGEKINIAGVVHRPGDEKFLQSLTSGERKVGMFQRSIKLPPAGSDEKEDIDDLNITAKMENGILIITVPKSEKEWTEIHKVDIE
ncbi:hypothetical protein Daesc_010105 [Daldinia eschscholtzii]|uniref:SHSP domain-containing protein n=1 Tax=Daldinia eschscholtzii TaxID=292717 RepID=A0AAX6M6U2_9PEZI